MTTEKRSHLRCITGAVLGGILVPVSYIGSIILVIWLTSLLPEWLRSALAVVLVIALLAGLGVFGAMIAYAKCQRRSR